MMEDPHGGYLGLGATLTGRLDTSGPFHVSGAVVGEIHSSQAVSVGTGGSVDGAIHASRIVLDGGTVKGLLRAETIEVRAESTVRGTRVVAERLKLDTAANCEETRFEVGAPTGDRPTEDADSTDPPAGLQSTPESA